MKNFIALFFRVGCIKLKTINPGKKLSITLLEWFLKQSSNCCIFFVFCLYAIEKEFRVVVKVSIFYCLK